MRKLLLFILLFTLSSQTVSAQTIAGSSATLASENTVTQKQDNRIQILNEYFKKYDSPLQNEAKTFVKMADIYNLDYRLLPSITGVESGFGKALPTNSYNAWGWGIYGNHITYFSSWKEAIETISKELRERFMNKWGTKNVYDIGKYYASDPEWAVKVSKYMDEIDSFAENRAHKTISISF